MFIESFIYKFGIEVENNEPQGFKEIMKNTHVCISYKNIRYYIPKENSSYGKEEKELIKLLTELYIWQ